MGIININIQGSFSLTGSRQFSAMHGGHAQAVAEAIEFLSSELLPTAIEQDHSLHTQGDRPTIGFGKKQKAVSCPLYVDYKKSCQALKDREEELKEKK